MCFRSSYWAEWEAKCKRAPITKYIEVTEARVQAINAGVVSMLLVGYIGCVFAATVT